MRTTETACHGATVTTIPIMEDNYAYIIARQRQCVVVDPGLAPPVAEYLTRRELTLCAILNTHQHGDHTGGNRALIKAFGGKLIGGTRQHGVDRHMADGETLIIADLSIQCIDTPGHTADSVCFHLPEHDALFSGDTLFCCGCGRPFGGAPETLWHSLLRLRHLPGNTQIFCGHEYTLENIAFALTIEPGQILGLLGENGAGKSTL
ncbi:MAG: hydroxyacylglutathione hydrolase, partial [Spartobacteria bacterium]|nr:hydroxyacylglutathione hydrolase [Spartobacteria bacterium]